MEARGLKPDVSRTSRPSSDTHSVTSTGPSNVLSLVAYIITTRITPTCLFALPNGLLGTAAASSHGFATIMTGRTLGALIGPLLLTQAVALAGRWNVVSPLFGVICVIAVCVRKHVPHHAPEPPHGISLIRCPSEGACR